MLGAELGEQGWLPFLGVVAAVERASFEFLPVSALDSGVVGSANRMG